MPKAEGNTAWMITASYGAAALFASVFMIILIAVAHRYLLRLIALLLAPTAPIIRSMCAFLARTPLRDGVLRRYFYPARHRNPLAT